MTIIFVNKDVVGLRVEIRWGDDKKTETFEIEKGGFGGFDIDKNDGIPLGSKCRVFAWKENSERVYTPEKKFHYLDIRGTVATFEFEDQQFSKPDQPDNWRAA